MTRRITIALGALALAGMGAFIALRLEVTTELTHYLPVEEGQGHLAELSNQLADSTLTRTMILDVSAPETETALAAARGLAGVLRSHAEVEWLRTGVDGDAASAYFSLFFPHRYQLLSNRPEEELPRRFSDEGLAEASRELKRQLATPKGPLVRRTASADPLLAFMAALERLETVRTGPLSVRDGQFVTADGKHAIVFVATKHSAFDGEAQGPFLEAVRTAFEEENRRAGGVLSLEQSGVNRFAVDSERIVKDDINRISTLSTIAILLVFLLLFRSIRVVVLSFVPLLFGMAFATTAGLLVFGKLHGLTLAFGSTLIGVCVDYPIHFLNHHALEPAAEGAFGTLRKIRTALVLGAVTTIAGFAGLAWTTFPGIREMAVFATCGILGALVATLLFLPALSAPARPATALHRRVATGIGRALAGLTRRRAPLVALAVVALGVCAVGLPRTKWQDSLSALNQPNPSLLEEDTRVRARVSQMDMGRFVLALGNDDDEALARNDAVHHRLEDARKDGILQEFRSVHDLLFSPGLQARNLATVKDAPELASRTLAALAAEGFRAEAFTPFAEAVASPPAAPLRLSEVLASPLADLVRPFRVELGDKVGLLTMMRDVKDADALATRLGGLDGVHLFDQEDYLARAYGLFRARTIQLAFVGLLIVIAILFAKYRRVDLTLAAVLPALLASATTLAILALLGVETNLLHVVSMLLVVSAGEDYAVFLVASADDPRELDTTALSLVLCCLSTVLGFGLLGVSEIPALRAMGLTTGIGILLSLLFAPIALLVVRRGAAR